MENTQVIQTSQLFQNNHGIKASQTMNKPVEVTIPAVWVNDSNLSEALEAESGLLLGCILKTKVSHKDGEEYVDSVEDLMGWDAKINDGHTHLTFIKTNISREEARKAVETCLRAKIGSDMDVESITKKYLIDNGYDGLCDGIGFGCCCCLDNFMPCVEDSVRPCRPGFKVQTGLGGREFIIVEQKPTESIRDDLNVDSITDGK